MNLQISMIVVTMNHSEAMITMEDRILLEAFPEAWKDSRMFAIGKQQTNY
jgi:hypothetical protein